VKTIQDVIRKWADVSPERTSLVSSQGSALSYRELAQAFDWLGATLLERELGDSPRLATVLPSGIMEAVTFLGVSCHAAAAPLNPEYAEGEFEVFLADLLPQALLLKDGFETPARGVARALGIRAPQETPQPDPSFSLLLRIQPCCYQPPEQHRDQSEFPSRMPI
jgi:acyl-CoA synthetase (AMP-forming)/AMP-acid ligase II